MPAFLGALLFRIRGGLLGDYGFRIGTTGSRLIWSIGLACLGALFAWDWLVLLIAPGLFVGCLIGWPSSIDMGRNEGVWIEDAIAMIARGLLWTLPAGIVLAFIGHPAGGFLFTASGTLCPLWYELGWRIPYRPKWAVDGSAWGEILFGAAMGTTLAAVLI